MLCNAICFTCLHSHNHRYSNHTLYLRGVTGSNMDKLSKEETKMTVTPPLLYRQNLAKSLLTVYKYYIYNIYYILYFVFYFLRFLHIMILAQSDFG